MRALYFGCFGSTGHRFVEFDTDGLPVMVPFTRAVIDLPWSPDQIDGKLAKRTRGKYGPDAAEEQMQGRGVLHHRNGWTALAFWDRSIDHRPGSNSVFFFDAILNELQVMWQLKTTFGFPIFERFGFEVEVVETVTYNVDGTRVV
jgi:hypothetical protein